MAEHLIDPIRAEKDISKEKLDYINEVDAMIKEMRVIYEKALAYSKKLNITKIKKDICKVIKEENLEDILII